MISPVLAAITAVAGLAVVILKHLLSRERLARLRDEQEWAAKERRYEQMALAIEDDDVDSARLRLAELRRELQKQDHSDSRRRGFGEDYEG